MAGHASVSQGTKLLSTAERTRAPFGWWYMRQDVVTCLALCFFAPHAQAAVGAKFHLCIVERNYPKLFRLRLCLTHAGSRKDIHDSTSRHLQRIHVVGKCFPATQYSNCNPSTVLHWCLTERDRSAVPVLQHKWVSQFKLSKMSTRWGQEPYVEQVFWLLRAAS